MKNFNLDKFKIQSQDLFERNELKHVLGGRATISCSDGTSQSISSCSDWALAYGNPCANHGGWTICSGGPTV